MTDQVADEISAVKAPLQTAAALDSDLIMERPQRVPESVASSSTENPQATIEPLQISENLTPPSVQRSNLRNAGIVLMLCVSGLVRRFTCS